jgi:hypothetical protein
MNPTDTTETTEATQRRAPEELPGVVTRLFRGVVYDESDEKVWQSLIALESQARDYVAVLGLDLILDETEGYAFLRSREDPDGTLPRLIPRRRLTFDVSLLLALLRGRLLEFDTNSSELRLIMSGQEIADMVAVFLRESRKQARILDRLGANIKKVVELGFLRKLRGQADTYEVARILKAYVDAQWLEEFDARLADYRASLDGSPGTPENNARENTARENAAAPDSMEGELP